MAKGTVYALRDISSGTIWTERSEYAAHQLAREKKLTITEEQIITHDELLRMIGHVPPTKPSSAPIKAANVAMQPEPAKADIKKPEIPAPMPGVASIPLPFPVRYHLEDEPILPNEAHLISRVDSIQAKSVFCSAGEISPKAVSAPIERSGETIDPGGPSKPR